MANYSGIVQNIFTKKKEKKTGGQVTINYFSLADGTEVSTGFKKTSYEVGQNVNFSAEKNYGELQFQGDLGSGGAVGVDTSPKTFSQPSYNGREKRVFPVPVDSGEFSIIRQSALKAAVETVATNFVPMSFTNMDDLVSEILRIAYIYTDFSSGQREVKALNDSPAIQSMIKDKLNSKV